MILTTKTAQALQKLKDMQMIGLEGIGQQKAIINFKNELKEKVYAGNKTHKNFREEIIMFCMILIQEIESVENEELYYTS